MIFIIVSINNQSVLSIKSDPSLEIIKQEDAEEGYFTPDQGILLKHFIINTVFRTIVDFRYNNTCITLRLLHEEKANILEIVFEQLYPVYLNKKSTLCVKLWIAAISEQNFHGFYI